MLLPKGFHVIGALIVGSGSDFDRNSGEAIKASGELRKILSGNGNGGSLGNRDLIGAVVDSNTGDIRFRLLRSENKNGFDHVTSVVYEDRPEKYMWERGCILRCEVPIKLPLYYPVNRPKGELLPFHVFFISLHFQDKAGFAYLLL